MPIKRKEEFEGVLVEDLDGSVEQGDCEQFPIGAEAHRQNLVRHLERARMCKRQMTTTVLLAKCISAGLILQRNIYYSPSPPASTQTPRT